MDLVSLPLIENAIVCGDTRPYLSALIALNAAAAAEFAAARGLTQGDPLLREAIRQELQKGIDAINARHSRAENIRGFAVLPEPLSIENGELTPTLKVRRQAVMARLKPVIDALYECEERHEASAASSGVAI